MANSVFIRDNNSPLSSLVGLAFRALALGNLDVDMLFRTNPDTSAEDDL